jgi:hypothetical protein
MQTKDNWEHFSDGIWNGHNLWKPSVTPHCSTIIFHNLDGINEGIGSVDEAFEDYKKSNFSICCLGDIRCDSLNKKGRIEFQAEQYLGKHALFAYSFDKHGRANTQESARDSDKIGETCIGINSLLEEAMDVRIPDPRRLGRFCATILRGCKEDSAHRKILLINLYACCKSSKFEEQQNEATVLARTRKNGGFISAFKLMLDDISMVIHDKGKNADIIIGGDFNCNFRSKDSHHKERCKQVLNFCSKHGLKNVLESLHPDNTFYTCDNSSSYSHIDHVYASQPLIQSKCITRAGVLEKLTGESRHYPIAVEIDWLKALNKNFHRVDPPEATAEAPIRMAYINDPEKRKEFADYVDNQINQAGIESDIKHMELLVKDLTLARSAAAAPTDHEQWELNVDGLYQNTVTGKTQHAAPAPSGPHSNSTDSVTGATAKLQNLMDATMNKYYSCFKNARMEFAKQPSNKKRNGWSPPFIKLCWEARTLYAIAKKARIQAHDDIAKLIKEVQKRWGIALNLPPIPAHKSGQYAWIANVKNKAAKLLKQTHGKKRNQWRRLFNAKVKNMEIERAHGVLRRYINSALRRPTAKGLTTALQVDINNETDVPMTQLKLSPEQPQDCQMSHTSPSSTSMPTTDIKIGSAVQVRRQGGITHSGTVTGINPTSSTANITYDEPIGQRSITNIAEHKQLKAEYMRKWMSRSFLDDKPKWMDDYESCPGKRLVSPFCQHTVYGRALRERVHEGDVNAAHTHSAVPAEFNKVLHALRFKTTNRNDTLGNPKRVTESDYGDAMKAHSTGEWLEAIKPKGYGSAPGLSNHSYAELKCSSNSAQCIAGDLCNISINSGLIFSTWAKECIFMIPKKEKDDRLNKQRPLKLQEILRKLTINIRRRRVVRVWNNLGLIDAEQFAYINAGGTVEPTLQKRMIVEDALHHNKPLSICDEDQEKAFDSVDLYVLELALRRLGVPYNLIDYFLQFHFQNEQTVRTAYGDTTTFKCERGACGQGADFSPFGYVSVSDLKNAVIKICEPAPYTYSTGPNTTTPLSRSAYADDSSSYSDIWGNGGLQTSINGSLLFCGFTGMQLHIDKSIFCWINKNSGGDSAVRHDSIAETPDIQLHGQEWRSAGRKWAVTLGKLRFFKIVEPNEYVTYLGSSQSHTGEWRSNYEAT